MLSPSKNQLYYHSVTFSELRVPFDMHVELQQIRSSEFYRKLTLSFRAKFLANATSYRNKIFVCHWKFIFLSFELNSCIFVNVVMKP